MLDLNMPKKGGLEVLAEMKAHQDLKRIPVVVMTSSKAEGDILRSYDLHANCYVTKPVDFDQFQTIVHSIESFWFTIVKLPSATRAMPVRNSLCSATVPSVNPSSSSEEASHESAHH